MEISKGTTNPAELLVDDIHIDFWHIPMSIPLWVTRSTLVLLFNVFFFEIPVSAGSTVTSTNPYCLTCSLNSKKTKCLLKDPHHQSIPISVA